MGSPRQLPYQLKDGGCICCFDNVAVDKGLFYGVKLQACKSAALFDVVQRLIDDYFLQPAVKISFCCIVGLDTPEHLYKGMAQDISRLMFVGGITHSNRHGKAIELPVQLFLRLSIAIAAIKNDVSKILFQLPLFVDYFSCKYRRCDSADSQFFRIFQFVVEPDIPVYQINNRDHSVIGAQFIP